MRFFKKGTWQVCGGRRTLARFDGSREEEGTWNLDRSTANGSARRTRYGSSSEVNGWCHGLLLRGQRRHRKFSTVIQSSAGPGHDGVWKRMRWGGCGCKESRKGGLTRAELKIGRAAVSRSLRRGEASSVVLLGWVSYMGGK
jgi:hypothetical protein